MIFKIAHMILDGYDSYVDDSTIDNAIVMFSSELRMVQIIENS